jgi:hypothetical protein
VLAVKMLDRMNHLNLRMSVRKSSVLFDSLLWLLLLLLLRQLLLRIVGGVVGWNLRRNHDWRCPIFLGTIESPSR